MIYMASAYTHSDPLVREQRFQEACRAAAALMRAGLAVLSPIAHSHPVAKHGLPEGWKFWSQIDCQYLARCDALAVLTSPGWRESVGVQAEIAMARELGIPILYITDPEASDPPTLNELKQGAVPCE